jgi:hypothetical protein
MNQSANGRGYSIGPDTAMISDLTAKPLETQVNEAKKKKSKDGKTRRGQIASAAGGAAAVDDALATDDVFGTQSSTSICENLMVEGLAQGTVCQG